MTDSLKTKKELILQAAREIGRATIHAGRKSTNCAGA